MPKPMREGDRSFKLSASSFDPKQHEKTSYYRGKDHISVGIKAARVLFKNFPDKGDKVHFVLKETTQSNRGEERAYVVERIKSDKPRKMTVGGKQFLINFTYSIHATEDK